MNYTDVFGSSTLPPAEYGYQSYNITADLTMVWPYNSESTSNAIAKIMEFTCAAGNSIILPSATEVSTGEDFLIKNTGSNTLTVKNSSGTTVGSVHAGSAEYYYLVDNTTADGQFNVIAFGVGTSQVDAATLVGYGIKAIGTSLNQSHEVTTVSGATTIDSGYRAKVVVGVGGNMTLNLAAVSTLQNDFFFLFRNGGTGTVTIDPNGSETVDGQAAMTIQPGESLMLFCSGVAWYSVGYGRSTIYQFTQLVKDISAGGTITLTASEASNKLLTFIGNPAADVTVLVPSVVSVYYVYSNLSTSQSVLLKTALGTGVSIPQGARIISLCDGVDVISAQSVQSNTSVSLVDGSATSPSLNFTSQSNTGLYKAGTTGLGIAVNGSNRVTVSETLTSFADITNLKVQITKNDSSVVNVPLFNE